MKIAFDTNILIYLLDHDKVYGSKALDAIESAIRQGGAVVSTVAVAEYLSNASGQKTRLADLLSLMTCVPVDVSIARVAGDIRQKHQGITLPDALHLASSLAVGASTLVTNDQQLLKLKKLGVLRIEPLA